MKRTLSFVVCATFFLVAGPAFAKQQQEETALPAPGLTPANPFYFLDTFSEWLRVNLFTFGAEQQANVLLTQTDERIAELKAMDADGVLTAKREAKIEERYAKLLEQYEAKTERLVAGGASQEQIQARLLRVLNRHARILDDALFNEEDGQNAPLADMRDRAEQRRDAEEQKLEKRLEKEQEPDKDVARMIADEKILQAKREIGKAALKIEERAQQGRDVVFATAKLEEARAYLAEAELARDGGDFREARRLAKIAKQVANHARSGKLSKPDAAQKETGDQDGDTIPDSKDTDDDGDGIADSDDLDKNENGKLDDEEQADDKADENTDDNANGDEAQQKKMNEARERRKAALEQIKDERKQRREAEEKRVEGLREKDKRDAKDAAKQAKDEDDADASEDQNTDDDAAAEPSNNTQEPSDDADNED